MAQASAGKLEHTGPTEKVRVASVSQREQLASMPEPPLPKEKQQSRLSWVSDHEGEESQGDQEPHLGEREGIKPGAWRGNSRLHDEGRQIPRRKGRESKMSFPRRSRRKHEWMSRRKSSPGRSAESWFHPKFGQTWNRKEVWETKCLLIRWKSEMSQGDSQGR